MSIAIREIKKEEYLVVAEIFNKYRIFYKQPSDLELAREYLKQRLILNEAVVFVAFEEESQQLLGFTLLYPKFSSVSAIKNWHIGDLYVEENKRKQGVGKMLLNAALKFATDHLANFISLNTAKDNFTAQKVYEDFGFEQKGYQTDYWYYQFRIR